jgi:hypothetical protein
MTITFYVMPFERDFWRSDFLLKNHQNPQVLKRRIIEKKIKEKKREKRERKRKAPRVSSNKGKVNILRGGKHFNFKNIRFDVITFSPLQGTISWKTGS